MDVFIVVAVIAFFTGLLFRSAPQDSGPQYQYVPVPVERRGWSGWSVLVLALMVWLVFNVWSLPG